jgi:DNA-binding MarR family transcriptional regulator
MSLETDINQPKFRTEQQKVIINIIYTHNWLEQNLKCFFDAHNITQQQFNILRILRGAGKPLSTLQIRQRMLDKMSDTSRIVDRMIAKDLLQKCTNGTDKRMIDVSITNQGEKLLEKIDLIQDKIDSIALSLSDIDAEKLNTLLDKLRKSE